MQLLCKLILQEYCDMSHLTGLEDPLVLIVSIHVVCSDSLYQAYMQFLCFPQKLDDARFGIQPVDDDDGKKCT